MSTLIAADGSPVEIAPGRGDLTTSSWGSSMRRLDSTPLIGGKSVSYANLFSGQPWVAAAVMRIMSWAVRVPLKCYRKTSSDSRIELDPDDHQLARMIRRPWMGQRSGPANQNRLVQAMLGPLLVHGNGVTEIETVGGDDWLRPLDWRNTTALGDGSGEVMGWRVVEGNMTRDVRSGAAVHLAWWSPLGPLGVSPLEQLGTTVSIEDAAQRYQQSLFARGARPPSAIIASPEFLAMEQRERQQLIDQLREDVNELYAGPDLAGKPAILPPGLDWKGIGHSAVEAALIDQRRITREEVAAVYQIPPPMIGILDRATYSNIETQKQMAYTDALGPPLVMIEQALTAVLARDHFGEDDVYVEFDFGPVLRGDRLKEINSLRLGIGSTIYSPNEARRALNLEAYPEESADKLYYPGNNLQPLPTDEEEEERKNRPPPPAFPPPTPPSDGEGDDEGEDADEPPPPEPPEE